MSKPKNNVSDLLAAIKRQPTSPTLQKAVEENPPAKRQEHEEPVKRDISKRPAAEKKVKNRKGEAVQFWMHGEDRKLVRELSAWLAGQGTRPSDSMVIRAALRFAKTGSAFLEAYWQAAKLDGRIKRD
jgi:hypothetical protein